MNHLASANSDINLPRAAERAAKKLEQLTLRSALTDEKRLQRLDDFEQVSGALNEVAQPNQLQQDCVDQVYVVQSLAAEALESQ